jgi:bifunctional enzyme CysN/CysC
MLDSRPLYRIACAGSVDDGKSTLIGRLLHDTGSILEDQARAVAEASAKSGESEVNLALLTDGLKDEREQKITIDVAYRPFSTARRRFVLADTPGHVQYTRNMFTGCSSADVVILLVDASRGPTEQTWRHLFIASMVRAPHCAVVINKMDLVGWSQDAYEGMCQEVREFCRPLALPDLKFFPLSALSGEGLAERAASAVWHGGESLLEWLDEVEIFPRRGQVDFRLPIQCAIRPDSRFRGFAGRVASGRIRVGEEVGVFPSGFVSRVKSLLVHGEESMSASAGDAAVIELEDDLDVGRGSVIARPRNAPTVAHEVEGLLCWMGDRPGTQAGRYRFRQACADAPCEIKEIAYQITLPGLHRRAAAALEANHLARVTISLGQAIPLDLYEHNREMGGFLLLEQETGEVAAAGTITKLLRLGEVRSPRESSHPGEVLWLTGMSGAGKTTLGRAVVEHLTGAGRPAVMLDGDQLRAGLCRDLGFSQEDRTENVRRTAEMARLLSEQGFVVVCSLISPLAVQRALAREIIGEGMIEIYVSCPLVELVRRDVKGLYAQAVKGEVLEFTGVSSAYEPPDSPSLTIDTSRLSVEAGLALALTTLKGWT